MDERARGILVGRNVFVALAVLTILEYIAAVAIEGAILLLFALALAKGWLIVVYFMHIGQLKRSTR